MSGGYFNIRSWNIIDVAEDIERVIEQNDSTEKNEWGENKGHGYSPAVIEEFAIAVQLLRRAAVYAQRADYLLSCDDGEDSFLLRLREDLEKLK